jgi:hypothetical protein
VQLAVDNLQVVFAPRKRPIIAVRPKEQQAASEAQHHDRTDLGTLRHCVGPSNMRVSGDWYIRAFSVCQLVVQPLGGLDTEQTHELFVVPPSGGHETTGTARSRLKAELRTTLRPIYASAANTHCLCDAFRVNSWWTPPDALLPQQ